ncbi:MAG: FAD-dependent oxidoreductase, partial [Oscillospiraceae bacterium]|nr:FAD-dependent oxidoreductase [Oscillospiraceae bacterium]
MYDVVIIGAGIVGAAVAYELSKYRLKTAVIEKQDDVAKGTTRANSAIIHAGYDPEPGTLMARSNVRGSLLWKQLTEELGIDYKITGSLVVARNPAESEIVRELYEKGVVNGVEGLSILSRDEALAAEPELNSNIDTALLAETAAVINPWQACIALSEFAAANGAEFFFNSEVGKIEKLDGYYRIEAGGIILEGSYIVNAAGVDAEQVHKLAGGAGFGAYTVRGEYYLLDKNQGDFVSKVLFPVPGKAGKGVVVVPTVHGNLLVGATAERNEDKFDTANTARGLAAVRAQASILCDGIAFYENIRNFAGNRAYIERDDFLVEESGEAKGFINMAGIKSPGLSSAPALAEEVLRIIEGL